LGEFDVELTSTRQTIMVKGERIPKGGVEALEFQCGETLGKFYVKILSITPYTPTLEYELISSGDNNNTYRIIASRGMGGVVAIPAAYNTKAVTEIGIEAFRDKISNTSVTIPASIKYINYWAFENSTGIASIIIPATVTNLSFGVFSGWTSSQTITIMGHANRTSTTTDGWSSDWDDDCNATIVYQGP